MAVANRLLEQFETPSDADFVDRLVGSLCEDAAGKRSGVPSDFDDWLTYLIAVLREAPPETLSRFGRGAATILTDRTSREHPCSPWVFGALRVLTVSPQPPTESLLSTLAASVETPKYRRWPTEERDSHRQALLCSVHHADKRPAAAKRWAALVEDDLNDPDYAAAALSALATQNPRAAATRLAGVLHLLDAHQIPTDFVVTRMKRAAETSPDIRAALARL